MVDSTPLSAAIRSIRTRLKLTQYGLSELLSVRQNSVWRYESGRSVPNTWHLINLYHHARTEEEIRPILQTLEARGVPLPTPDAGGEPHQTPAPAEEPCSASGGHA
jgi:transcriptional regulator with XRE-family HTH domain